MLKVINVTAVPFHFARLQSNATKNIFQRTAEICSYQTSNNGVPILTPIQCINESSQRKTNTLPLLRSSNDRMMKKRSRILKNRLAAKASREKWRQHRDLLEQQLQNLKEEKMRLLMENEELRLQHNHLEEEHISLKRRFEDNPEERRRSVSEDAIEHAEEMGSSTHLHLPLDDTWGDFQQLPDATVPDIPLIEDLPDFEQLFELSDAPNFYEGSDVFVCPLSEDITKETSIHDSNAIARTVSQEIEVSCSDEETSIHDFTAIVRTVSQEMEVDGPRDGSCSDEKMSLNLNFSTEQQRKFMSEEATDLSHPAASFPQLWTFDNLYEDIDDGISLFS